MRIFLFVFLLLGTTFVFAQKTWTLQECVNYAIQHNIDISKVNLNKPLVENELSKSKHELLPTLSAYGSYSDLNNLSQVNSSNVINGSVGLSLALDLTKGITTYNNIQKNKLLLQATNYTIESNKNDVTLEVATAFMYMLFSKEKLSIISMQIQRSLQEYENATKQLQEGEFSDADLVKYQIQLAQEELQKSRIENECTSWRISLAQAMNVRLDSITDISLGMEFPFAKLQEKTPSLDSLYNEACYANTDILAAQSYVRMKDYEIALAKMNALPTFSLAYNTYTNSAKPGSYNYITNTYAEEQLFNNMYGIVSAQLSIPIFNKFSVKNSVTEQKIYKQKAEFELLSAKENIYNDIATAYYDMQAAKKEYEKQESILELTKKSYSYTLKKNEVGEISTTDFLLEKNKMNSAEVDFLISRYTFLFHKMILDFYVNNKINF